MYNPLFLSGFLRRLYRLEQRLIEEVERKPICILIEFTIVYFAITCWIASEKLLWTDEFFTLYLARLPTLASFWDALATGADQHPPLFYLIVRGSLWLFGENELALRLPGIVGYWTMCVCLYFFVARRTTVWGGLLALLFPLVADCHSYAYEARGYALVLGFAGLAVLAWQAAGEARFRRLAVFGLALSLAGAVGSHYYALLMVGPLAIAELTRSWQRRRLDLPIWCAFAAALAPIAAAWPLIASARTFSPTFWAKPSWTQILSFHQWLVGWGATPVLVCAIVVGLYAMTSSREGTTDRGTFRFAFPLEELVVVFALLASPILGMLLAKFVTGAFHYRYAIFAMVGLGATFALVTYSTSRGHARVGAAAALVLVAWFVGTGLLKVGQLHVDRSYCAVTCNWLEAKAPNLPIVFTASNDVYELTYYAPPELAKRCVYLADPAAAQKYLGHDTVDRCALALKPWFQLPFEPYQEFLSSHEQFYVVANLDAHWNWLLYELIADDLDMRVIDSRGWELLLRVTRPTSRDSEEANSREEAPVGLNRQSALKRR